MQSYDTSPEYMDYEQSDNIVENSMSDYRNSDFKVMVDEFVENFEQSRKKKIVKKEKSKLELFMGVSA